VQAAERTPQPCTFHKTHARAGNSFNNSIGDSLSPLLKHPPFRPVLLMQYIIHHFLPILIGTYPQPTIIHASPPIPLGPEQKRLSNIMLGKNSDM
jgi:hypothetical protein